MFCKQTFNQRENKAAPNILCMHCWQKYITDVIMLKSQDCCGGWKLGKLEYKTYRKLPKVYNSDWWFSV